MCTLVCVRVYVYVSLQYLEVQWLVVQMFVT